MTTDDEAFDFFLNETVPEHFHGHSRELMEDCFMEHGKKTYI